MSEQAEAQAEGNLGGEMSIFDHLAELRRRLIYSMVSVAVGFAVSWTWRNEIFQFILAPMDCSSLVALQFLCPAMATVLGMFKIGSDEFSV